MKFESETIKTIQALEANLQALKLSLSWEKRLYVQSMVEQGWTEVHIEEQEDWGSSLCESWFIFSPNVPKDLVESARNYRYFNPQKKGIADEDYCDLT